jgi:hypothetical protein
MWGAIGAIGGAALGALGASSASAKSAAFSKEAAQKRYQWMVADLKKAGLNPMLAFDNSPGQASQPNFENVGEAAVRGAAGGSSAAVARETTKLLQEQQNATRFAANKTAAETKAQEQTNLINEASPLYQSAKATIGEHGQVTGSSAASTDRWTADLEKTRNEASSLAANTKLSELNSVLAKGNVDLQQVQLKYAEQMAMIEAAYRAAMSKAAEAGVPAAQADAAFWEDAGVLGKLAIFLRNTMPALPVKR